MIKKPETVKSENERREDQILKRMLDTPPKPHKPKPKPSRKGGTTKKPGK